MTRLEAIVVADTAADERVNADLREVSRSRSVIVAPLIDSGEGIGMLAVMDPSVGKFDNDDLYVIKAFADLASIALQNARAVSAERDRAELESELAEAQLREAMRSTTLQAVIRAQEEERARIARELHDSFGQSLTSILLGLKIIEQEDSLDEARARVAELRAVAAAAATDVRRIAHELRPIVLDDLGLDAAIERYGRDVEARTGIRVSVSASLGAKRLDSEIETVVYRVAQEAVTNAVKHARPSHLEVVLEGTQADVRLTVTDDGAGFDAAAVEGKGLGLLGMRERSELVGGKLSVRSEQGDGTTVELHVPRARS